MRRNSGHSTSIDAFEHMAHIPGHARVFAGDQEAQRQFDALTEANGYRIFLDIGTGALESRPGHDKFLNQNRPGNTRRTDSLPHARSLSSFSAAHFSGASALIIASSAASSCERRCNLESFWTGTDGAEATRASTSKIVSGLCQTLNHSRPVPLAS